MSQLPANWFEPRSLYADGYPSGLTSALQVVPALHKELRSRVAGLNAEYILELGPGTRPLVDPGPKSTYVDISHALLKSLEGQRVEASVTAMPFGEDTFDLVVLADVLVHLLAPQRAVAIAELRRLAPLVFVFHPLASGGAKAPLLTAETLEEEFTAQGFSVKHWPIAAPAPQGVFRFALLLASRTPGG